MSRLAEIANQEAQDAEHLDDALEDNTDQIISLEGPVEKKGKGRPQIHDFAGRTYLLKKELQEALSDVDSFINLMNSTYVLSAEREEALQEAGMIRPTNEISYTFNGPINLVIEQINETLAKYEGRDDVASIVPNISKERMVAPTSKLYQKPIMELVGKSKSGREIHKRIFEEYSPERIYGYVTVTFK